MKPLSVTAFALAKRSASHKWFSLHDFSKSVKILCFSGGMLAFSFGATAQQLPARQLDKKIENLKATGNQVQSTLLKNLVYSSRPTLYINNSTPVMEGNGLANVVDVDASSLALLSNNDPRYKSAKLLVIHLENDSDKSIRLSETALKGFSSLKYVLFSSRVSMNDADISQMFTEKKGSQLAAIYKVLAQDR